jgi:hypothetical protein
MKAKFTLQWFLVFFFFFLAKLFILSFKIKKNSIGKFYDIY